MSDDQTPLLVQAVSKLTVAVEKLDSLLRDEYPKRSEVERNFTTKLENQRVVTKILIGAIITVFVCFSVTVGTYSQCFVGEESPSICKYVPGYEDRIARREAYEIRFLELQNQIDQLNQGVKKSGR